MKVIKKGRQQKGWAKEYECSGAGNNGGGCGATLLVEQADLFSTFSSSMGRDSTLYTTFECVDCGVKTDIPSSDTPSIVRPLPTWREWKFKIEKD